MFTKEQILGMAKRLRESYVDPMEAYMNTKHRSEEFIEEVNIILSSDHVLSPFKAKDFPFDCLPISFDQFNSETGINELEFFSQMFRTKMFRKAVLNNASFKLITLMECQKILIDKKFIEDIVSEPLIFVIFPEDTHVQLFQITTSRQNTDCFHIEVVYFDSSENQIHPSTVRFYMKKLFPTFDQRLITIKKGKCPIQKGKSCGLLCLTNLLYASRASIEKETCYDIYYNFNNQDLYETYLQMLDYFRGYCLIQDLHSAFHKYKFSPPSVSKEITKKKGTFNGLVHLFQNELAKKFGFTYIYI